MRLTCLALCLFAALGAPPAAADQAKELETMRQFLAVMDGYYAVIENVYEVSSHPDKAAIIQLQKIEEVYKERGELARAIDVLRSAVDHGKSQTIKNAAAVMLADALKETGRSDEAVKVLRRALEPHLKP